MLETIRRRLKDMSTLRRLFLTSETCARSEGLTEPGAEHFVQAALTLPDQTAQRAFRRFGAAPADFAAAVTKQYADALRRIGVDAGAHLVSVQELPARAHRAEPFVSKPSAQALIKRLAKEKRFGSRQPLLGADIVLAALTNEFGPVVRALKVMGIEPSQLVDACKLEIEAMQSSGAADLEQAV